VNNNNLKPDGKINESALPRFKPTKRPSVDMENPLLKMLDSMIGGLEQSMGKRMYLCGNPGCGTLIIFHSNEPRPVVCLRCGSEIDWEGEYITRIRICPTCNKEYDSNAIYCQFHSPPVSLIEKEIEK
jgi:hypothetical protein